jgi:serpin B
MHAKLYSPARYGEKEGVQVVELPYKGGSLVFDAILPKDMKTYSLDLEGALSLLQPATVEVALPRFEVEQKSELGDALVALGVKTAFTDAADFSGFTSDCPLKISRVISRTTVRVDEEGTVAAAATVATMSCGAAPHREKVYSIVCDRPFFFAIRDAKTGAVAFFGRVTKPGSQRAK